MNEELAVSIDAMLKRVEAAIDQHRAGEPAPLSYKLLQSVADDIRKMQTQWPTYPVGFGRFVLDWPDDTQLRGDLIRFADQFERARTSRRRV